MRRKTNGWTVARSRIAVDRRRARQLRVLLSNELRLLSRPGETKSKMDQISLSRFSMGAAGQPALALEALAARGALIGFLMCCASSRMT